MYFDAHRGEYYTPNRHYNPRLGRWNRPDPFFHAMNGNLQSCVLQAGNLFAYTMNNPVMFVDPSGLSCEQWFNLRSDIIAAGGDVLWDIDTGYSVNLGGVIFSFQGGAEGTRSVVIGDRRITHVCASFFVDHFMPASAERVFLASYSVSIPFIDARHAGIVMMVDSRHDYWRNEWFTANVSLFGGGIRFAISAAGPGGNLHLRAELNRNEDVGFFRRYETCFSITHLTSASGSVSALMYRTQNFIDHFNAGNRANYRLTNSNSFAHGLLMSASLPSPDLPDNLSGGYFGWIQGSFLVQRGLFNAIPSGASRPVL